MSAGAASFKYFRNTMVRDLTSVEYMREVVTNLGLLKDSDRNELGALTKAGQHRRDSLARSLAGTLNVTTASPSEHIDIIQIAYIGPDSSIGRRLVDEVKRTYIRQTMDWIHDYLTNQRDYFANELKEASDEVKAAAYEETRLRLENPHVDPRNPGALVRRLEELVRDRKELILRQREYGSELSTMEQTLAAIDPRILSAVHVAPDQGPTAEDPPSGEIAAAVAIDIVARIYEISRKVQELRDSHGMTDLHPDVQSLLKQRGRLDAEFQQQPPEQQRFAQSSEAIRIVPPGPISDSRMSEQAWSTERARLLVQISGQKAKLKEVEIGLGSNEAAIEDLRQAKSEIYEKQEEFAGVMSHVRTARQRRSKLEVTLASIEPAIKAVEQNRLLQFTEGQPARGSSIPISPRSTTVVLLSLIAGIAAGILLVVLAEVFDQVLRSSSQVARSLGLPMLETIDEIVTSVDRRRLFVRKAVISPLVVACFIGMTVLSGSLAYLSLQRPWAYQRISRVPRAVFQLFAGTPQESAPVSASDATS